ncbi:MAG: hypothetical protein HY241_09960 [Actinobacteria bacterium]|nr:hypothetical protein [Actinomycetota bacterium]
MRNVMWQIRRLRLDRIGAPAARFFDVTIDLSGTDGHPLDSILWLRNGGGKSSVLSLVCAVIRPHRREFLAMSATGKHVEDYVLGPDTAHVIIEWSGPSGRRLVTGAVYEWADRTQPADPNRDHDKLQSRWYAFTPVPDRADFDLLPFDQATPLPLKEFVGAVRGWAAIPGCGAVVADNQDRWSRVLDDHGLDPELFTSILQMNATEGGIEGQFQFRNTDAFVRYLLELTVEPEVPRSVSDILESVRAALAERPALHADLAFADEAVPLLRRLASARARHLDAVERRTTVEASVRELRDALVAAAQRATADQDTHTEFARIAGERATAARRAADLAYNRSVEFRRIAAVYRQQAAQRRRDTATQDQKASQAQLDAWRAVPHLAAWTAAQGRVAGLAEQLAALTADAEPLRRSRDAASVVFATALDRNITTLTAERADAARRQREATERADAAKRRRSALAEERGRTQSRLDSLTETLDALRADVDSAVAAGHLNPGEDLDTAIDRVRRDDKAAEALLGQVAEQRAGLTRRRDTLADRERELDAARTRLEHDRSRTAERQETLTARVTDLAGRERLRTLAESDDVDPLAEGIGLIGLLDEQITRADRRRVEIAVQGAEDDRATAALAATNLLPPVLDVAFALAECERSDVAVTSGWSYLADSVPAPLRAAVFAAAPALAGGVLVYDPDHLPVAQQLLTAAASRPTSVVAVATTADFQAVVEAVAAGPVPSTFVVPTAPALTDKAAAGAELELRDTARVARTTEAEALARQWDTDDDLRRALRALLADCPPGTLARLATDLAELDARIDPVVAELAGVPAQRADLDAEAPDLDAADTRAQAVRRSAARTTAVLTALRERHAAAGPLHAEAGTMPAAIAGLTETITKADADETEARAEVDVAKADAATRLTLITGYGTERARLATATATATATDGTVTIVLDQARHEWQTADAAYRRETSESVLAGQMEEATRAVLAPADEVANLPPEVRARAEQLFSTPAGSQPLLTKDAIRAADATLSRRGMELTAAGVEAELASAEVDQHTPADRRRRAQIEEHETPPTREEALAAADATEENQRAHLDMVSTAQEHAADAAERGRDAGSRAEAMRTAAQLLGATRTETVGDDITPYPGTDEAARSAVDTLRAEQDGARTGESQTAKALDTISTELALWANDDRFMLVKSDVRTRFRVADAGSELGPVADDLAKDLTMYAANLRGQLTELDEHKSVVVTAITGMVRQALRTIDRAQRFSELPESLGPWAGQRFLDVGPRTSVNTSEPIVRDRCARLVDVLTARGAEVPRGLDLLWQATSSVVGDGNWRARVLKPSTTFALDRVSVEKMRKWSGGEKVTTALLLFCMVAKLRAQNRGRELPGLGVLPLDNPLGKANYVVFLDLQRRVAAANGIQLLFLTGVGDMKAVGRFPNIVRMRNAAHGPREYVRVGERTLTVDDPAGIVDSTRVWRDDPVLRLL